jgi:hypothetical protein
VAARQVVDVTAEGQGQGMFDSVKDMTGSLLETATTSDEDCGNKRQEAIVLDQVLAKSSNVTTPENTSHEGGEMTFSNYYNRDTSLADKPEFLPMIEKQDTDLIAQADDSKKQTDTEPVNLSSLDMKIPQITGSIDDDFFSMSFRRTTVVEPRKKRKKLRKARKEKSETPADMESPGVTGGSSNTQQEDLASGDIPQVIVLDDDDGISAPKKKRKLSFPEFDEEALRREVKGQLTAQYKRQHEEDDELSMEFEDEFSERLKSAQSKAKRILSEREGQLDSGDSSTSNELRNPKKYSINITSYLPGSENHPLHIDMKGHKPFSSVISKILKYLLAQDGVSETLIDIYVPENVVLMRDSMELLDFMKPDSLNICAPDVGPIELDLGLYTRSQIITMQEYKEQEKIKKLRELEHEEELDRIAKAQIQVDDLHADDKEFEEIDREIEYKERHLTAEPEESEEDGYFRITLKGGDKAKIEVKVKPDTLVSKLASYYLKKTGLQPTTRLRLVFDDEDLDLSDTVGDTELEEDFTVDVYVIK